MLQGFMAESGPSYETASRCPHIEPFAIGGRAFSADAIINGLHSYITPERRAKIERVVASRTYSVVPVLEGLYDRGNVSAVLRSAEALGYQAVHVIETSKRFKEARRVTQGAEKWLDIRTWTDTQGCIEFLRDRGYRILAADVHDAEPIESLRFDEPAAVFFGNERDGLSEAALEAADARIIVPMVGFTQSYNISVASALALYHIRRDRCDRMGDHGDLNDAERRRLTASCYLRSVEHAERILLRGATSQADA